MRIDAYSSIGQVYQNKSDYKGKAANTYSPRDDKFEISDAAKSYSTAKAAVAKASDVRMDKVADIKARMAAGTYDVSPEAVADKIIANAGTIAF